MMMTGLQGQAAAFWVQMGTKNLLYALSSGEGPALS